MSTDVELLVLQNLIQNKPYSVRVLPHLKREYFSGPKRPMFNLLCSFVSDYKKFPAENEFNVYVNNDSKLQDNVKKDILTIVPKVFQPVKGETLDFLIDLTEEWCKEQALHLSIIKSIDIIEGKDTKTSTSAIPSMVKDALSVSFDTSVGHAYFDAKTRYDWYTRKVQKVPFGIDVLDNITNGGYETKTLNLFLAGTHVGKTLGLCDLASKALAKGEQVLYITLEIAEEKVAQRVDANLIDTDINDIPKLQRAQFEKKVNAARKGLDSDLIIKEYPNGSVHAGHFRALLEELERKKNFKPKLICIDYLNLCASEKTKDRGNTYNYFKSVSEELRSLAMEKDVAIWSATQLNREGFKSSDPGLENTSDSFGVAMTADFALVLYQDEHLKDEGQYMCKQQKNRYGDMNIMPRFNIGVDRARQRLFDVSQDPIF